MKTEKAPPSGRPPRQRVVIVPNVMGQRAAALLVGDQRHLDAVTGQQANRGLIDAGRQHLLGTALQ